MPIDLNRRDFPVGESLCMGWKPMSQQAFSYRRSVSFYRVAQGDVALRVPQSGNCEAL